MCCLLILLSLLATSVYSQTGTCDPTQSSGPALFGCPAGQVEDSQGNCCPPAGLLTTPVPTTAAAATTVAGATTQASVVTNALGQTVAVSGTCVDLLNPRTGVSDCPARASYCNDPTYFTVMTQQCPRTCGRCTSSATASSSTNCVDLLNPQTGVSDCPARAALCNDANYASLMTVQCPRTCGRCSGTTGSTTASSSTGCVDLLNPRTGVSDCPARAALCNDSNYYSLMTVQCPRTCGRCNGSTGSTTGTTASTATGSTVSSGTCVDLTNPATGTSDCPRLAYLCTNSAYAALMRTQCPATCGFCSG